jgi:hypothetical protein
VSTLSFRVTEKFGLRYFDFDEGLVEEDVFFRPSEKTNGEESGGYCNISKRDDNDKGREKEGRSWLITAGDLRNDGGVSVQMERLAESGWNGMRLEIDSSKKMGRGERQGSYPRPKASDGHVTNNALEAFKFRIQQHNLFSIDEVAMAMMTETGRTLDQ